MNAIIIDDESSGRKTIRSFITKYAPKLQIIAEAESVRTGLEVIHNNQPDIVFLDIRMNDGTGFDLLEKLGAISFQIIFVTAYEEHAIKAFKYSAVDYLLKPLDPDEFIASVSKLKKQSKLEEIEQKVELLLQNHNKIEKIALPTLSGLNMIKICDIVHCESDNNYTNFHLIDGSRLLVSRTLKEYDEMLSSSGFYRTHKSHLVNVKYIVEYIKGEGGIVKLENGDHVEVSRRRKDGLIQLLAG
jgi:two-component system LytT family response regulator